MRLLLDENLPKKLKQDFVQHDVSTVSDMGWNGKKTVNC
jgi:predicted nuclease of predicted toxin-antitoxin system